jgi:glutaminyl-tRNA synthetase
VVHLPDVRLGARQSDSIEGITHSICTLEFEVHRPLYDWFIENSPVYKPQQIEFARLNLTYTVMSKRKLLQLVKNKHVNGWDDPRMPTLAGCAAAATRPRRCATSAKHRRRQGEQHRRHGLLEFCVREDLNKTAPRAMACCDPLKV